MASSPASKWRLRYFHKLPLFSPLPLRTPFYGISPPARHPSPTQPTPRKTARRRKSYFPWNSDALALSPRMEGKETTSTEKKMEELTFSSFSSFPPSSLPASMKITLWSLTLKKDIFPAIQTPLYSVYLTWRNVTLVNPVQVCQCMEKSFPWGYWQVKKKRRRKRDIHTLFFPPAAAQTTAVSKEEKEIGMSWSDPFSFFLPVHFLGGKRSVCAMGFCLFGATIFPLLFAAAGRLAQIYLSRKNRTPVASTHNFLEFLNFFRPTHRRPP